MSTANSKSRCATTSFRSGCATASNRADCAQFQYIRGHDFLIPFKQCCGSKYIESGSGSRILAQFGIQYLVSWVYLWWMSYIYCTCLDPQHCLQESWNKKIAVSSSAFERELAEKRYKSVYLNKFKTIAVSRSAKKGGTFNFNASNKIESWQGCVSIGLLSCMNN